MNIENLKTIELGLTINPDRVKYVKLADLVDLRWCVLYLERTKTGVRSFDEFVKDLIQVFQTECPIFWEKIKSSHKGRPEIDLISMTVYEMTIERFEELIRPIYKIFSQIKKC